MFALILCLFLSVITSSTSAESLVLPTLSLPWGNWTAQVYEGDSKIYVFRNVRFGDEPTRFGPSSRPKPNNGGLQDSSYGPSCVQIDSTQLKNPPGGQLGDFLGAPPSHQSEDCLFLDIYVPVSATQQGAAQVPVVVWFYGGAYAIGTKDINKTLPLYKGQSMLEATSHGAIFVAGNYRLGAFGWLAGHYMQHVGQPNAGLHDQALLLEWVRDYIYLVGGDNTSVSAWGESAGGGSILHHLIRRNGTRLQDPLFQTILVQSPAFQWSWDNSPNGTLDSVYREFSRLAGCGYEFNISCLQTKDIDTLSDANQNLFKAVPQTGLFPLGPSVDGDWITQIPALSFANNQYWTGIKGALISHVAYEEKNFIPKSVISKETFNDFLDLFLPGDPLAQARQAIAAEYNCTLSPWNGDYHKCVGTIIRDSSFTCNTRQLFDAYSQKSYMLRFAFPTDETAVHASDLVPTFMNNYKDAYNLYYAATKNPVESAWAACRLTSCVSQVKPNLQQKFQAYFASFALYGNPNQLRLEHMPIWPLADGTLDELRNVMQVNDNELPVKNPFQLISDTENTRKSCSFWTNLASSIEKPPTLVTQQPSSGMRLTEL